MYGAIASSCAALLDEPLVLVDVGCRWGAVDAWKALGRHAEIIGFDADPAECERLERAWDGSGAARFLPYALGAAPGTATLHLTESDACASLFKPIDGLWDDYPQLVVNRPTGTRALEVVDLDSVLARHAVRPVDVMQLDVQGAELDVLRGATQTLQSARVIEAEVFFEPIYEGQALFPDVHAFMRERGFKLWRFDHFAHYTRAGDPVAPRTVDVQFFDSVATVNSFGSGQLFWGNAAYVHERTFDAPTWQEALRNAVAFGAVGVIDRMVASLAQARAAAPPQVATQIEVPVPAEPAADESAVQRVRHRVGTTLSRLGLPTPSTIRARRLEE